MNSHKFKINDHVHTITPSQMLAIYAILKLVPEDANSTAGNKVRAIKYTRNLLGIGLKEAKDLVDLVDAKASLGANNKVEMAMYRQSVEYIGIEESSLHEGGGRAYAAPKNWTGRVEPEGTTSLGQLLRDKLNSTNEFA